MHGAPPYIPTSPAQQPPVGRIPVIKANGGDTVKVRFTVLLDDGTPATPDNSTLLFALNHDRFACGGAVIWEATWDDGIVIIDDGSPGLVQVTIPTTVTETLRRGSYAFSAVVKAIPAGFVGTVTTGTLQIEYEPTSPNHNIAYRGACS